YAKTLSSSQRGKWAGGVPPRWLRHCRRSPFASRSARPAIRSLRDVASSDRGAGGGETPPAPPECRRIGITPLDALWILRGDGPSSRESRSQPAPHPSERPRCSRRHGWTLRVLTARPIRAPHRHEPRFGAI